MTDLHLFNSFLERAQIAVLNYVNFILLKSGSATAKSFLFLRIRVGVTTLNQTHPPGRGTPATRWNKSHFKMFIFGTEFNILDLPPLSSFFFGCC